MTLDGHAAVKYNYVRTVLEISTLIGLSIYFSFGGR